MNSQPKWKHYRAIHSRYPPVNVFDTVDNADALLLAELEGETNGRLTSWHEFVKDEDARFGDGWGAIMASFCYVKPGRFNTDGFGAYYCADSAHTAIAEWSHHSAKTLNDFGFTDAADATIRCYTGSFKKALVDISASKKAHSKTSYDYSQALAYKHYRADEFGLLYRSVRHKGGLAAALFRPPATSKVTQAAHYSVQWNGNEFVQFAKLSEYEKI